jgi:hypothetical protein
MPLPADPADLSPTQRLAEIAAILARGVSRWRDRPRLAAAEKPPPAPENSLGISRRWA